jgi:myo-inositol-1-phosphate synthase
MLNNTFQLVFKGGDICRFTFFDSAIQSAPHWIRKRNGAKAAYLEPNNSSMLKPVGGLSSALLSELYIVSIYRGAIVYREHNSSRQFQPQRSDAFYKDNTDKKSPNTRQRKMPKIKVALIGVGNCASAFIQGLQYYGNKEDYTGLRNPSLGGLAPGDIQVVAAFDVDDRKVGKDLAEALFAKPNNAPKVAGVPSTGIIVNKGPLLDGIGKSTQSIVQVSAKPDANVTQVLKVAGAEIVINLLPSGATEASRWYTEQALAAGCAFVNATPAFIASDAAWAKRFEKAGLPLAGDDLVDQVGSTALHKTLLKLLSNNGVKITETYQLDVGGGTESLDTLDRSREAKRTIKTQSVASSLPYKAEVVAGSTDYVDFLQNNRDSYFWISGVYFCNAPMQIDLKFSTVDAPNAGSVLFDVVRAMKIALDKKFKGAIIPVCAYAFKRPPQMLPLETAEETFKTFIKENSSP